MLRRMEPIRWTPYMDECVSTLASEGNKDMDVMLIAHAKSYMVINQMTVPQHGLATGGDSSSAPSQFLFEHLQLQLRGIQQDVDINMQGSGEQNNPKYTPNNANALIFVSFTICSSRKLHTPWSKRSLTFSSALRDPKLPTHPLRPSQRRKPSKSRLHTQSRRETPPFLSKLPPQRYDRRHTRPLCSVCSLHQPSLQFINSSRRARLEPRRRHEPH